MEGRSERERGQERKADARRDTSMDGHTLFKDHYVLLIGISKYNNASIPLQLGKITEADSDAERLEELFNRLGYPKQNVTRICNGEAALIAIRTEIGKLSHKCGSGSFVLVIWCGHGCQFGGVNYLLPCDAELYPGRRPEKAMTVDWLCRRLSSIDAPFAAILDTCYSIPNTAIAFNPQALDKRPRVKQAHGFMGTAIAVEIQGEGGILRQCLERGLISEPSTFADSNDGEVKLSRILPGLGQIVQSESERRWKERRKRGACPYSPYVHVNVTGGDITVGLDPKRYQTRRAERELCGCPLEITRRLIERHSSRASDP